MSPDCPTKFILFLPLYFSKNGTVGIQPKWVAQCEAAVYQLESPFVHSDTYDDNTIHMFCSNTPVVNCSIVAGRGKTISNEPRYASYLWQAKIPATTSCGNYNICTHRIPGTKKPKRKWMPRGGRGKRCKIVCDQIESFKTRNTIAIKCCIICTKVELMLRCVSMPIVCNFKTQHIRPHKSISF